MGTLLTEIKNLSISTSIRLPVTVLSRSITLPPPQSQLPDLPETHHMLLPQGFYLLFPLPGKIYIQISICMPDSLISSRSLVQISPSWEASLTKLHKIAIAPNPRLPLTLLYLSV